MPRRVSTSARLSATDAPALVVRVSTSVDPADLLQPVLESLADAWRDRVFSLYRERRQAILANAADEATHSRLSQELADGDRAVDLISAVQQQVSAHRDQAAPVEESAASTRAAATSSSAAAERPSDSTKVSTTAAAPAGGERRAASQTADLGQSFPPADEAAVNTVGPVERGEQPTAALLNVLTLMAAGDGDRWKPRELCERSTMDVSRSAMNERLRRARGLGLIAQPAKGLWELTAAGRLAADRSKEPS